MPTAKGNEQDSHHAYRQQPRAPAASLQSRGLPSDPTTPLRSILGLIQPQKRAKMGWLTRVVGICALRLAIRAPVVPGEWRELSPLTSLTVRCAGVARRGPGVVDLRIRCRGAGNWTSAPCAGDGIDDRKNSVRTIVGAPFEVISANRQVIRDVGYTHHVPLVRRGVCVQSCGLHFHGMPSSLLRHGDRGLRLPEGCVGGPRCPGTGPAPRTPRTPHPDVRRQVWAADATTRWAGGSAGSCPRRATPVRSARSTAGRPWAACDRQAVIDTIRPQPDAWSSSVLGPDRAPHGAGHIPIKTAKIRGVTQSSEW